jgi:hypothetical protein
MKIIEKLLLLIFLLTVCQTNLWSRTSLAVNSQSGNPLFYFDIANGPGENYPDGRNPSGSQFFWTLEEGHYQSIIRAAEYWSVIFGNAPTNTQLAKIAIGIYNDRNDDASSDFADRGNGKTNLTSAIINNNFSDDNYFPNSNPSYTNKVHAQVRIGVDSSPYKNYFGHMHIIPSNGMPSDMTSTIIHEMAHALGIKSSLGTMDENFYFIPYNDDDLTQYDSRLLDSFGNPSAADKKVVLVNSSDSIDEDDFNVLEEGYIFFSGPNTTEVLDGTILTFRNPENVPGIPINGFEGRDPEFSHIELRNSLMSHQNYRNWNTLMEAELAVLQDIGIPLDRKNFFGKSIYESNITDNRIIDVKFYARDANGYKIGDFNSTPLTIGLHIYGSENIITMTGEVLSNGDSSVGVRIDGWKNNLTIDAYIHSDGDNGIGLLVAYGKEHNIVHIGTIAALGKNSVGMRFDFGDNEMGNLFEYRGSYKRRQSNREPNGDLNIYSWSEMELLDELDGPLVEKVDISGEITAETAIYISRNAFVKEINILDGAKIQGDIISDW